MNACTCPCIVPRRDTASPGETHTRLTRQPNNSMDWVGCSETARSADEHIRGRVGYKLGEHVGGRVLGWNAPILARAPRDHDFARFVSCYSMAPVVDTASLWRIIPTVS